MKVEEPQGGQERTGRPGPTAHLDLHLPNGQQPTSRKDMGDTAPPSPRAPTRPASRHPRPRQQAPAWTRRGPGLCLASGELGVLGGAPAQSSTISPRTRGSPTSPASTSGPGAFPSGRRGRGGWQVGIPGVWPDAGLLLDYSQGDPDLQAPVTAAERHPEPCPAGSRPRARGRKPAEKAVDLPRAPWPAWGWERPVGREPR